MNLPPYLILEPTKRSGMEKRTDGPRYTLLWEEEGQFLINRPSDKMLKGKSDRYWVAQFRCNSPKLYRQTQVLPMWKCYEFIRKTQSPELPPLKIVTHRPRNLPSGFENASPSFTLSDYLSFRFGQTIGVALNALPEDFVPLFAIKRKGQSIAKMAYFESDDVKNAGVYSFFRSEDDVCLTKIALGTHVERDYDFREAIADYNALLP